MDRRTFIQRLGALPLIGTMANSSAAPVDMTAVEALQRDWKQYLAPNAEVATSTEPLQRSDAEWRKLLNPQQFNVMRQEGTERAGTSPLNDEKRAGVFVCAGCNLPLFTTAMKFDSGTGWPSFFTTIPGVFEQKRDWKLIYPRTEYHCAKCGSHHGHVFNDGPKPTGLRYCNNGVALKFIPKA